MKFIDPDGKDWWDKVAGFIIGTATNIVPGTTGLRNTYTPNNRSDYNRTLQATDAASLVVGGVMIIGGGSKIAAGGSIAAGGGVVALSGVGAPVGGGVAAVGGGISLAGAIEALVGTSLTANSAMHLSSDYNYGDKSEDTSSSSSSSSSSSNSDPSKNFKKISDKQLKDSGIDAHQLKKDFLGDKAKIAHYDLYKDNKTGEILILQKGGKGTPINTGEIIQ